MEEKRLVSEWESIIKNKDQEAEIHTLHKYEYDTPQASERTFLSQASPTIITSAEVSPRRSKTLLTADIPDIHYGFRNINGVLVPTHDHKTYKPRPEIVEALGKGL